jgi:hypothetical protein
MAVFRHCRSLGQHEVAIALRRARLTDLDAFLDAFLASGGCKLAHFVFVVGFLDPVAQVGP